MKYNSGVSIFGDTITIVKPHLEGALTANNPLNLSGNAANKLLTFLGCPPCDFIEGENLDVFFSGILEYLDLYSIYNFLRETSSHFRDLSFSLALKVDVSFSAALNLEKIVYYKMFPDDDIFIPAKMEIVRQSIIDDTW
jgi:hypothetical protein